MNNLTFCNDGIYKNIEGLNVEILSHNFHNPNANIVCTYFMQGDKKIEVTYYKHLKTGQEGYEIYYFNSKYESSHHYSRRYNKNDIPKRFKELANKLINAYNKINFEEYKTRILN